MANQLGPQPDLVRPAQGVRDAATELGKFGNLPAFAEGDTIMQQIQQMQQSQQQLTNQMNLMNQDITAILGNIATINGNITTIRGEITTLRTSHLAAEHNSIARFHNSFARRHDQPIVPFRDPANVQIPNFPAILVDLRDITGNELNRILRALDQSVDGTVAQMRERLRSYVGVPEA